jgi:hypothetical protein
MSDTEYGVPVMALPTMLSPGGSWPEMILNVAPPVYPTTNGKGLLKIVCSWNVPKVYPDGCDQIFNAIYVSIKRMCQN